METPSSPETPAPATPKGAGIAKKINMVIYVVLIIIVALIYFGQKIIMGKKYKVSDMESVNYSEKATEADAKILAEALKANGFFNGKKPVDVLLKKDDKEGTVVSFVGEWDWKSEKIVTAFQQIGEDIAARGLGKPLTVRLMDTKLNAKNDIKVP